MNSDVLTNYVTEAQSKPPLLTADQACALFQSWTATLATTERNGARSKQSWSECVDPMVCCRTCISHTHCTTIAGTVPVS